MKREGADIWEWLGGEIWTCSVAVEQRMMRSVIIFNIDLIHCILDITLVQDYHNPAHNMHIDKHKYNLFCINSY